MRCDVCSILCSWGCLSFFCFYLITMEACPIFHFLWDPARGREEGLIPFFFVLYRVFHYILDFHSLFLLFNWLFKASPMEYYSARVYAFLMVCFLSRSMGL